MTVSIGVVVAAAAVGWRPVRRTTFSLRLFHAAHAGQRPCHFGASAPHSAQT
jgi:hypothetical protein